MAQTNNKKINSPLDALTMYLENDNKTKNIQTDTQEIFQLKHICPDDVINWELSDRPSNELGDLEELGKDILKNGQIQPCVVREKNNKYELIVGERRWRACKLMNLPIAVIVSNLNDEEALLAQASENENRKSLSDYAKGKQYSKIIKQKIFTQETLAKKLNKSRTYVRQMLSFDNLDPRLLNSIDDLSKISSRTSYEIYKWQQKGEKYINILISLSNKLRSGDVGEKKLSALIEQSLREKKNEQNHIKATNAEGKPVYTWSTKSSGSVVITIDKIFSKNLEYSTIAPILLDIIENGARAPFGEKNVIKN